MVARPAAPPSPERLEHGSSPKSCGLPQVGIWSLRLNFTSHDCVLVSFASFVSGLPPSFGGVAWNLVASLPSPEYVTAKRASVLFGPAVVVYAGLAVAGAATLRNA